MLNCQRVSWLYDSEYWGEIKYCREYGAGFFCKWPNLCPEFMISLTRDHWKWGAWNIGQDGYILRDIYTYIYIYLHKYISIFIFIYRCIYVLIYVYTCISYINTYIYRNIYIYIIYIYTCSYVWYTYIYDFCILYILPFALYIHIYI